MIKTVHISSCLGRSWTQYEEGRLLKYEKDLRDRLKEVYGETLPRELDREIEYIVREIYTATRNDIVQYDLLP